MGMDKKWNGRQIQAKIDRASGRAIVGAAVAVSTNTKTVVHAVSGDLRRSVHAAPVNYDGSDDPKAAATGDMAMSFHSVEPTPTLIGPAVEVGSWMPYACVEWVGRGHPGITQGLESVRGQLVDRIVARAFHEEGLI